MRGKAKEKIALLLLIGLAVFFLGSPVLITESHQVGMNDCIEFTKAYTAHDAILLDGNEEMIAQADAEEWPGNGTEAAPYIISGYYFDAVQHCIEIRNIDLHWVITDNEFDGPPVPNVWCGVEISDSKNGIFTNNLVHNRYRGLWLIDIYNVVISNNIIEDNPLHGMECIGFINACVISDNIIRKNQASGIRLLKGIDSEISGNHISDCDGTGIQIMSTVMNCEITDNIVESVTGLGIHLGPSTEVSIMHNRLTNISSDGIYVLESDNLEMYNNSVENGYENGIVVRKCRFGLVHNNTINGTDGIGLKIVSGGNSTFRLNRVENATDYGLITAAEAENMTITRNVFINNGEMKQVCDDGVNNEFIYNYYDDWASPDMDSNQIVDEPYVLDGDAENEDPYPLANPNAIPPPPETTNTTTTSTTTSAITTKETEQTGLQIPLGLIEIGAGVIVLVTVSLFFLKRKS